MLLCTSRNSKLPLSYASFLPCLAEVPPLPIGFGGLTVPFVTLLPPTLPQQLNAHFLVTNNTLSATPLYFIFIGAPLQGCNRCSAQSRSLS